MEKKHWVIVFLALLILIVVMGVSLSQHSGSGFDIDQKLSEIRDAGYMVKSSDWSVYSGSHPAGKTSYCYIECSDWNDFVRRLNSASDFVWTVYVDRNNEVIWFEYHGYVEYLYY